jgi:oxygen-independent coproporphyrinogen-3 oxidase
LSTAVEKRNLYEAGKKLLVDAGFYEIGMDHFSLPQDSLFMAKSNNTLHRNFMGYTTSETDLLVGLGTSAISDAKYAYAQNAKSVEAYQAMIATHHLAISKGHVQSNEDLLLKECIQEIACAGKIKRQQLMDVLREDVARELKIMQLDGLLTFTNDSLIITETGKPFIRNICKVFDMRLKKSTRNGKIYSKAI